MLSRMNGITIGAFPGTTTRTTNSHSENSSCDKSNPNLAVNQCVDQINSKDFDQNCIIS
jgi:hypothetical protein